MPVLPKDKQNCSKFWFRDLIIIVGILVIGSFIGVLGTYISLKQIVNHF